MEHIRHRINRNTTLRTLYQHVLSFGAMLITGLVVITVLTASTRFNDPDLWWQLRVGQIIATTHSLPATDTFSFTADGHPWTPHEWLAQLSMYLTYAVAGQPGLMVWLCSVASLIFISIYTVCWIQTRDPLNSFLGSVMAWFFATVGFAVRPATLGYLLLALTILVLEVSRTKDKRWLWCLPPIFALWVNCHASYIFGIVILGVYWLCARIDGEWGLIVSRSWDDSGQKLLGIVLLICTAALCCNPVGFRLLLYPFNTAARMFQPSSISAVEEWMPPDLGSARGLGLVASAGGLLLLSLRRREEVHLRELILISMAFGLALQHVRMLFLFGLIGSPALCRSIGSLSETRVARNTHALANLTMILVGIGVIIWAFPSPAALQRQVQNTSPVAAVNYLRRAHLPGPMLNDYVFGGYLIWALPEQKVFVDGRADVYDWSGVFEEYGRWATLTEDPTKLLDKYQIRLCVLRAGSPMTRVMNYVPGWRLTFSDAVADVFMRVPVASSRQSL